MIQGETTFHRRPSLHRGFNPSGADIDFAVNLEAGEALRTHKDGSQQEVVINEDGADIDFRVESDGVTNMLLVDASLNGVGIGGAAASGYELNVTGNIKITGNTDSNSELYIEDTSNEAKIRSHGATVHTFMSATGNATFSMGAAYTSSADDNAFNIVNTGASTTLGFGDYDASGNPLENNTAALTFDNATGNVGIGGISTYSSAYALQVTGSQYIYGNQGTELQVRDATATAQIIQNGTTGAYTHMLTETGDSQIRFTHDSQSATATNNSMWLQGDSTTFDFEIHSYQNDAFLSGPNYTPLSIDMDTGNVGIGGAAVTSAALAVTSTTSAFMPPRMTTTQRDAISSAAAGMIVYNTTTNVLNFHNGTGWKHFMTF